MWDSKLKIWTIRCSFVALSNNAQKNNQLLPSIRIVGWSEEDEFGLLVLHSLKNGRHIQCKIWQPWNCTPHMVHLRKQRGHLKLIKERKSAEHWCTQQSFNRQKSVQLNISLLMPHYSLIIRPHTTKLVELQKEVQYPTSTKADTQRRIVVMTLFSEKPSFFFKCSRCTDYV